MSALRQLVRRPGLSLIVILMLALGIGATTAIFSLFHEVLLRPLPVPEPDRLVNLVYRDADAASAGDATSYPMFRDLEAQQSVFAGLAARVPMYASVTFDNASRQVYGELVSGGYFQMLGVQPAVGRLIGPQDEPRPGESAVVVLSYDMWRSRFNADRGVIGETLRINGQSLTIVGVAAARFTGLQLGSRAQFFVPLTMRALLDPTLPRDLVFESRGFSTIWLTGRLRPGIDTDRAEADLNATYSRIRREIEAPVRELSPDQLQTFLRGRVELGSGARGWGAIDGANRSLPLLLGVTLLVLAIICANVANLWFARNASRAGEMAVRESLGASRSRLFVQLLLETSLPAAIGGALSFPVAAATLGAVALLLPPRLADGLALEVSPVAVLFAIAVTVAVAVLSSVFPAVRASRTSPALAMKGFGSQTLGGRGAARVRGSLATAQIALSMVLLVLAGLFAQSLANVARIDLGIGIDSLLSFDVAPRLSGYTPEQEPGLYARIAEALSAQPGVASVTSALVPLVAGNNFTLNGLRVEGSDRDNDSSSVSFNLVGPDFFRTVAIGLRAGRDFTAADATPAARVAIVNERFTRDYGVADDPLGKQVLFGDEERLTIVGVVADAAYNSVRGDIPAQLFLPRTPPDPANPFSFPISSLTVYVRAAIDPDTLLRTIPRVVASVDPTLPVTNLITTRRQAQHDVFVDRLVAILSASFAVLATLLAAVGLYGVLSYGIAERTRELGLRLALGAEPNDLRAMVLRQVAVFAAIGIVAGGSAAIGVGRLAESLLYGLTAADPLALANAAVLLLLVVLGAGYWPAQRAARIAPMEALRHD